jgi:hypothetical protein
MAFSDRGSLLQAPPNLYKVLLAFSQPLVAYVVVGIPTCSSPLLKNPKVSFGCCRDALVTKVTGLKVYGWIQSAKVPQTQSISTTCRDRLGLVDFVRKESRFRGFID